MLVPRYWALGRMRHVEREPKRRQITVRRHGWSDDSQEAAQAHAEERAREALARILAGEDRLERTEPKVPYNGAEGIPIREEIVSRHGEAIVTRNSYGARCLNVPDVLFLDIDFGEERPTLGRGCMTLALFLTFAPVAIAFFADRFWIALASLLGIGLLIDDALARARNARRESGEVERAALERIGRFLATRPDWRLRIYRTPAGLRGLAMHRTFDPAEPEVARVFQELEVDPTYSFMCLRQRCFRARVSPKPWRIGLTEHLRPRPGVWPVHPDRMPARLAWIEKYESASRDWAACRYVGELGEGSEHPTAVAVRDLHDAMCRAESSAPLA